MKDYENGAPNPGTLRTVVQVRAFETTTDHGNEIRTPKLLPKDYCHMEALDGRELQSEKMIVSEVRFRFLFRYRPQYKASMQILKDARVFEVLNVIHDEERHERTTLLAKEVNPA